MATVAYLKRKASNAITSAVSKNGEEMAQQITDDACKLIADRIPDMTAKITNGVLGNLKEKIDSDEFSKEFVNVLQQKLLDEKTTSEPFLNKFSTLFDRIVDKALELRDAETAVPPVDAVEPPRSSVDTAEAIIPVVEAVEVPNDDKVGGRKRNKKTHKRTRKVNRRKNKRNKTKYSLK